MKIAAMVLQALIDESYTNYGKNDSFVLAGGVATAEAWTALAPEWAALLLEHGRRAKDGKLYFHGSEAQKNGAEHELFWRVIEEHVPVLMSCQFYLNDLSSALERIYHPEIAHLEISRRWVSPYTIAFYCLMNTFHGQREKFTEALPPEDKHRLPTNEVVDFYFDDNPEHKGFFRAAWERHMETVGDDRRHLYGQEPQYVDDKKFLPLQVADFWASWKRRWYDEGGKKRAFLNRFDGFAPLGRTKRLYLDINWDEEALAQLLSRMGVRTSAESGNKWREPLMIRPKPSSSGSNS
jgi:hypothetical protein